MEAVETVAHRTHSMCKVSMNSGWFRGRSKGAEGNGPSQRVIFSTANIVVRDFLHEKDNMMKRPPQIPAMDPPLGWLA